METSVAQCTAWKLTNLFSFFKGEWFLDQREGVPYFQYVMVSNPNMALIANLFRQVCFSAPGVASVSDINLNLISRTRSLEVDIQAQTAEGVQLLGGVGKPFILAQKLAGQ